MKIRMLTTKAGPDGGWNAGDVLNREDGQTLVDAGVAVLHEPVAKVERAVAAPQRAPDEAPAPAPPLVAPSETASTEVHPKPRRRHR